MKVTILGSGPSGGIPALDHGWGACDPANPRNRRTRSSALIEAISPLDGQGKRILIDTSPDLRSQFLDNGIRTLDGVIFTHGHADHTHGVDDLRAINRNIGGPLPIWGDGPTLDKLRDSFGYVFGDIPHGKPIFRPWLEPHLIGDSPFSVAGIPVIPFEQDHGWGLTQGLRIGDFAYSTDLMHLPEEAFPILEGIKVWVIGVFGPKPHPTHAHVDLALEWIERVKPERAWLTHLGPGLDYAALEASLPSHVRPAHDGLVISID
ncbi:MBL fold metallo-hydrolase [Novispirillum itersonii]|uniref:Phosphoribosyl 1,2-cyclic phosphate phosphodiesterase n=1 Tax=Novispirillum itersonii TaxID=189 RepID=A0A7W9ZEN0_NOVIT|nr:MBL fold metallo-hydrolase [Novispirillum itersonii]MBB6210025.1 phosphoribosyl 1,2-cyclic phosphate phosphodiesterase [Novispirillum itersonii]